MAEILLTLLGMIGLLCVIGISIIVPLVFVVIVWKLTIGSMK